MNDNMKNLIAGGKNEKKATAAPKKETATVERKYKNIYLTHEAIALLTNLSFTEKAINEKHTIGDTVYDGLKLLAKKKGIKL